MRTAVVFAEFDERAGTYGLYPMVLTIYDFDLAAAGELARDLSAELERYDGWKADPDPAAYAAEHGAARRAQSLTEK